MLRFGEGSVPLHLKATILVAIFSRMALFFGSMVVSIPNGAGQPVSPLMAKTSLDVGFYQWVRDLYFGNSQNIIELYERFFAGNLGGDFFLAGPLFPSLLHIFDYGQANSLPLAAVYLLVSAGLAAA